MFRCGVIGLKKTQNKNTQNFEKQLCNLCIEKLKSNRLNHRFIREICHIRYLKIKKKKEEKTIFPKLFFTLCVRNYTFSTFGGFCVFVVVK